MGQNDLDKLRDGADDKKHKYDKARYNINLFCQFCLLVLQKTELVRSKCIFTKLKCLIKYALPSDTLCMQGKCCYSILLLDYMVM